MKAKWLKSYYDSFKTIKQSLPNLKGIFLGLNVNVDAITYFNENFINDFLQESKINLNDIKERIENWNGIIEEPVDYIAGLLGCLKQGKASEWIIQNKTIYQFLLTHLSINANYRMGGQSGIMANILSNIGIRNIFVNAVSLSQEQKKLFSKNVNIKIPCLDETKKLIFLHPKDVDSQNDKLYLHIISEFKQNDKFTFGENIKWICPRNNRFIATYDPPNSKLELLEAIKSNIEQIANLSDGFIISGFHMIDIDNIGYTETERRIENLIKLLERAKKSNPDLLIQLEFCSTKKQDILFLLLKWMKKKTVWDSISCNERELAEILIALGDKKLADKIKNEANQNQILKGCFKIIESLNLKRIHLHQYGSYIIIVKKNYPIKPSQIKKSLLFASIITSYKALVGKIDDLQIIENNLKKLLEHFEISNEFRNIAQLMRNEYEGKFTFFSESGIKEINEFNIIVIPTIIINNPLLTVGLGDTISSVTFAAELSKRKS